MKFSFSLRARIALFFVALLVSVQLVAFAFVNQTSYDTAQSKIEDELNVGQRVFERVLAQNSDRLVQAASILAADFGFREAVATRDIETVRSALENHGARIHASAMTFLSPDGKLVATSGSGGADDGGSMAADVAAALASAREHGSATGVQLLHGSPYQLVVVPVRAPVTIGWIALWFAIDEALAQDLRQLTTLDVSFVELEPGHCQFFASTLTASARQHLERRLAAQRLESGTLRVEVPEGTQQLRLLPLSRSGHSTLAAVIERPLATALHNFHALQTTLVLIGVASLVLSAAGSLLIARGITAPIHRLLDSAQQMRRGDYDAPIDVTGNDEIGALAAGLDHMRLGIHERERRILRLAYEDTLTSLPNRLQFGATLQTAIVDAAAQGAPLAILLLDLNRFKLVNDALGHGVGDHVLQQVALRLRNTVGAAVHIARLGGDEFAILLEGSGEDEAVGVARKIVMALEDPIDYEGQPVDVGASIGIARFPEHGRTAETLMRNADIAMYEAKSARADHALFDPSRDSSQQLHLSLIGELRLALERDELDLYYQPKLAIGSACVVAAEALVRWHHPQRGFVPPGQFIPFAESTGYIRAISTWVLERAIRQAGEWRRAGHNLQISINLSTKDLLNRELPDMLSAALARHAVPAAAICLEITESGFMEDPDHVLKVLNRLSNLGVSLSIDDYGTGYSSLTYLMRLPVSELKIDRSFIGKLGSDQALETIVRSTVDLGHRLGLKVVAEGVEDPESLDVLAALGCDSVQGYLISPPLPAADFEIWLRDRPPLRGAKTRAGSPRPEPAHRESERISGSLIRRA
jgi:diguanylate cyclase (GGDEF)-like protein